MKYRGIYVSLVCFAFLITSGNTYAEENIASRVTVSTYVTVSPDEVWRAVGSFCSVARWQSLVAQCDVEENNEGMIRTVVMADNTAFIERLDEYSQKHRSFSYSIVSGPIPVKNYHAQIRVDEQGSGTKVSISAWYDVPPDIDRTTVDLNLTKLFQNGLNGMKLLINTK